METSQSLWSDAEQEPLPGLEALASPVRRKSAGGARTGPSQLPLMVPVRESTGPWPLTPTPLPGQLTLDGEQLELREMEDAPVQLALLDDPPIWEASGDEPPAKSRGRLARRRSRTGITPGQTSIF